MGLSSGSDDEALLATEESALSGRQIPTETPDRGCACTRTTAVGTAAVGLIAVATAAALTGSKIGPLSQQPWMSAATGQDGETALKRWSPVAPAVDRKMLTEDRPRVCTAVSGKDILGDTVEGSKKLTGQDADSCLKHCRKNPDCGCYAFDPSRDGSCWLKRSPCNELYTSQETEDMTTGTCRERLPRVCNSVLGKDIEADVLIKHDEKQVFNGEDAVTCRQRCEETDGCNGYAFDPSRDNTCWLKGGACHQFSEHDESADMISGSCHEQRPMLDWHMSSQSDDGGKLAADALKDDLGASHQVCTTVAGKDLNGAEALEDGAGGEYPNSTAISCRSRCGSTRACKCYVFAPSLGSTCWLKRGPCDGGYISTPQSDDMVSGTCRQGRPLLDWPLRSSSKEAGLLERFRVVAGARKGTVGLLSHHGTYVTAQSDGSVTVDGDSMGDWETFDEVWLPSGRIALRSFHGGFLAPTRDGMVTASAKGSGEEESFRIEEHTDDNSISFQTAWGKFLTAVRLGAAGKVRLRGDREVVGSWATFILRATQQEGRKLLLGSGWVGNMVTLQSYLGTYVGVGLDGEVTVNVQEKDVGHCEEFKLVDGGEDGIALRTCQGTFLGARPDGSVFTDKEALEWQMFRIENVDSKTFFSVLDLPVAKLGNLNLGNVTGEGVNLAKLDPDLVPRKMPQPVALKTVHGGYLFPLEEAKRVSDEVVPSEGTRVTQAMIFTRACEDSGLMPIADRSDCEVAATSIGLVKAKAHVDVKIVEDFGVPEGCYVENRTHVRLGTNPGNQGTGVVHREDGTVMRPICVGACPKCAMSEPTAPALVVLFHERDLCRMRLLASSLTRHDPNQLISTVHLIWISTHSPKEFMGDIDSIRNTASASHTVRFHDMSWMHGSGMQKGGHVQQIVTLKAASLVEEDYYVVFDAKNAFIRDLQPDTFLTPCYQGRVFADTDFDFLNDEAKEWYDASAAALGVDVPPDRKWFASITPVVMHTQTVIDMLTYLHEDPSPLSLCSGALCGHIESGATEFTLYYLYVATKTDEKCIHHASSHNPAVSMGRDTLEQNDGIVKAAVDDAEVLLFGAESGALSGMDGDASQRISKQLQDIFKGAGVYDPSTTSADSMAACVAGGGSTRARS